MIACKGAGDFVNRGRSRLESIKADSIVEAHDSCEYGVMILIISTSTTVCALRRQVSNLTLSSCALQSPQARTGTTSISAASFTVYLLSDEHFVFFFRSDFATEDDGSRMTIYTGNSQIISNSYSVCATYGL